MNIEAVLVDEIRPRWRLDHSGAALDVGRLSGLPAQLPDLVLEHAPNELPP